MRTWRLRTVGIVIALVLLFSAAVVGTYAWDSEQKATNSVSGAAAVMVPVTLIKEEKLADGTMTGNVIPNTAFYLFYENGTQIGAQYVTDEKGEIHVELNAGSYYFEEAAPAVGYTYDRDQDGAPVTRYPFQVTEEAQEILVQAYNVPLTGSLLIRKTVENSDGAALSAFQKKVAFTFVVDFSDGKSYDYQIDGTAAGTLESGGTLTLTHGQTASFTKLPVGLLYNVTEQTPAGYTVSSTGHRGNITEDPAVASFINRADSEELGALTISKTVEGGGANLDRMFRFTVTVGEITETVTLKHGESTRISGLPVGTPYTVEEEDASADGYYASVRSYTGHIVSGEAVELPFVNVYDPAPGKETGSLTITKGVRGFGADKNLEFQFTIMFTGPNAPANETFTLRNGESKTFWDIPLGTGYIVREETASLPAGYYAVMQEYSGTVAAAEQVVLPFVNGYNSNPGDQLGRLEITKTVIGGSSDSSDQTFEFRISFYGENAPESEFFTLRAGKTATYYAPHGTLYLIEEVNTGNCEAVLKKVTGTFVGGVIGAVEFTNVAQSTDKPPQTGELIVRKKVSGEQTDTGRMFAFSVEFEGEGAPQNKSFFLKDGWYDITKGIPEGVTYTVKETGTAGYQAVFETTEGTIVGGETAEVTFTNIVPGGEPPADTATIRVTKQVIGDGIDPDQAFHITLTAGSLTETFSLKDGETREFKVPAGTIYEVREADYFAEGYSQSIQNGYGIAAGTISVTVTNTYQEAETVEISGVKTWDMLGYTDVALPEAITVQLWNQGLLVEEQTVAPDPEGNWSYSFTARKFNGDGTEAVYEVIEAPILGYEASYDGYDITNTYIPPVEVAVPAITKIIEGEAAPQSGFWFALKGKTGYPMPDGADGLKCLTATVGGGEASFGTIKFYEPGVYTYTVYEVKGDELGWEYDSTVYTVTFTVTDTEEGLACSSEITCGQNVVERIEFTNRYTHINLNERVMISGEKIWKHGSNPESNWPDHVIIEVYGNGEQVAEQIVTAENGWAHVFELPRYTADGVEIHYSVNEEDVQGYSKSIDGYCITNTYIEEPGTPDTPERPQPDNPNVPDDIPHTGDEANLPLWIAMMVIGACGLIITLCVGRKPRYKGRYLKRRS